MYYIAQTWCARNLIPGRPGSEYVLLETQSASNWWIGGVFCSMTASSRDWYSNLMSIVVRTVFNSELQLSGSRTSSSSSTCSWTCLPRLFIFFSSSKISFSCSDPSWADGLILRPFWHWLQCQVFHWEATIRTNLHRCNTINSIHSIRTSINTSIILLPTLFLSFLSSTLFRTCQRLCIMIRCCAKLVITCLAGTTFNRLITYFVISIPVVYFISTKNIVRLCLSFNLKAFEWQQLNKICQDMGSFIIWWFVYNPMYSSSHLSCAEVHLNIDVSMYGSFRPPFLSIESISSSQCLTSEYEAYSCLGYSTISLPFDTQWITTMNALCSQFGRLPLAVWPMHYSKLVTGSCLPHLPIFIISQTFVAHCIESISTRCCRIHWELSTLSKSNQFSSDTKTLQWQPPSAGVHLNTDSKGSAPG